MEYRLGCAALVLALTGCFSEPPSGGGGSSSSSTTGDSSGGDSESTEPAADSSGSGGLSSSSGAGCELIEFDVPTVSSDVIVLVDQGAELDAGALLSGVGGLAAPGTNVALLVHADEAPNLPLVSCDMGCGMCDENPATRVVYPYVDRVLDALLDRDEFECILRNPPPGNPTTGPTKHLWLITNDPEQELPETFFDVVEEFGLRVHLSCPLCDENFGNVSGDFMNAVTSTLGNVSNSNNAAEVGEHATLIAASRVSCGWTPEEFPANILIEFDDTDGQYMFLGELDEADCDSESFFARDIEGAKAPAVTLCPTPCSFAQTLPAPSVDVYGCY